MATISAEFVGSTMSQAYKARTPMSTDKLHVKTENDRNKPKSIDDDDLETVLDLTAPVIPYDDTGKRAYEKSCKKYGVVPSSNVIKRLQDAKDLDLKYYGLGPKGAMALSVALVVNATVTTLNLRRNNIDKMGVLYIQQMMCENVTVTDLDLSENNLRTYGARVIVMLLQENKSIRRLSLSGNEFTDIDAQFLTKPIEEHVSLEYLDLSHNNFGDPSGPLFERMLSENGALVELDLSWNNFRIIGGSHLASGLRDNAYLKCLDVSWNGIGDEAAKDFGDAVSNNNVVLELDLTCCRIGPEGFTAILKGLKSNEVIEIIRIGKNNIPEEVAGLLIELLKEVGSTKLKLFDMTDVIFSPEFQKKVELLDDLHPELEIKHGYGDSYGKRKMAGSDSGEDALLTIKDYIERHDMTIAELFEEFDDDNSYSVSHDEFREGIKIAKIDLTDSQVDALINFVDMDGDGDIDFSELVLKMKEVTKKRKEDEERQEAEKSSKRKY